MGTRTAIDELLLRLPVGVFFIESGRSKRNADDETAQGLHGFAAGTYPVLGKVDPRIFVRVLSAGEIALGTALVAPVVPAAVAGAGLTAFSLGTLGLYLRTRGMRREGSLRPTQQGIPLAKDTWILGIGLSLIARGLSRDGG